MSELTKCNFCTLQSIKSRAKAKGSHIVTRPGSFGIDVFVVPKDIGLANFEKLGIGEDTKKTGQCAYRVASLLEVTSRCCC